MRHSAGSCPQWWCSRVRLADVLRVEPGGQAAIAGRLTSGSSGEDWPRPLDHLFVVLFEQDGTEELGDGGLVGEDPNDFG